MFYFTAKNELESHSSLKCNKEYMTNNDIKIGTRYLKTIKPITNWAVKSLLAHKRLVDGFIFSAFTRL